MGEDLLVKIWEKLEKMDKKIDRMDKGLSEVENETKKIDDIKEVIIKFENNFNEEIKEVKSRQYTNSPLIAENRLDISNLQKVQ
ncbi:MAG: hypothetical protein ACOC1N_02310 [Bacillota bacterium]